MKRHGCLFDQIFTQQNLYLGHQAASKAKRKTKSCFDFGKALGDNIAQLLDEIHGNHYRPRPYHTFMVHEPKPRLIHAPAFRDRVVQHAIYAAVYPLFDATFIDQSFACRPGYGTHKASLHLQHYLQHSQPDEYYLQLDIRKFFYSINRDVLRSQLERKIKDGRLVDLMMLYAHDQGPVGIPIGNLLSQLYALIYLNPLDHFIKRELKIKQYVRYVDDFVLVGISRTEALQAKQHIISYLTDNLQLELSRTTLQRISKGINFVGYRTWRNRRLIRRRSLYNFSRAMKSGKIESIVSLLGHAIKTQSMPYLVTKLAQSNIVLPRGARQLIARGGPYALPL